MKVVIVAVSVQVVNLKSQALILEPAMIITYSVERVQIKVTQIATNHLVY